jgi:hypothetical protein
MNIFNIDWSVFSGSLDEIPKKISFLYLKPHYFFTGVVASSVLANMNSFPLHKYLFVAKFYLTSNWQPFILELGSIIFGILGIYILFVLFLTGLIGTSRNMRDSNDNVFVNILFLILGIIFNAFSFDEDNPLFYINFKSVELYMGASCFFANLLVLTTLNLEDFFNLIDHNKSLSLSAGLGFMLLASMVLIVCLESVKKYLGLNSEWE